ncbi:monovalent cation:proton antiporter-2 (CPA2) family protein [Limoniibacter endophyticus]|uniref:Potassium transporter n=1 Tax=Limoniibacter endophyticus TaxID=1565040 RepID=A0A8J3GFD7_9HYPH|nr:monovalent cation:proton antiporter-2 (CPA2) family protein [Limoniibacter endophyticus]GHC62127.1 potassium transporter [Limoniibacter endophyticus]
MAAEINSTELANVVILLGAGVIAAPIFRRIGLGSVLGYLAAGLAVGPSGLGFFQDSEAVIHIAELGVVMFLFIIGLEMEPAKLWSMRKDIFGVGAAQVLAAIGGLTLIGVAAGYSPTVSFVAGTGFVLTSTAIVMQVLQERGAMATLKGQRIIAILLFEDLAIVPLLAIVALLGTGSAEMDGQERLTAIGIAIAAVVALVIAGRYLLNPMFRLLASWGAREVMTAAALLVVLGSALLMQVSGLSMAMGAFVAGVLLSESHFRHQLEADIEPFRGILLGLFFLGVGMAIDLGVIAANWQLVVIAVGAYMVAKAAIIYGVARLVGTCRSESIERAVLMAQGGEFAFVLYSAAVAAGILDAETNAILTATIIISMILTPLMLIAHDRLMPAAPEPDTDGLALPQNVEGTILMIGFGRFGQIVSQPLLGRGYKLSLIDKDADFVREAESFGFKVYYGDGTRSDILHASGAATAKAILICVGKKEISLAIARMVKEEFPLVPVMARAYDRGHAIDLVKAGVDYQIRETLGSALAFSEAVLDKLEGDPELSQRLIEEFRELDAERFEVEIVDGIYAGRKLVRGNAQPADIIAERTRRRREADEEARSAAQPAE